VGARTNNLRWFRFPVLVDARLIGIVPSLLTSAEGTAPQTELQKNVGSFSVWAHAYRGCLGHFVHDRHNEILAAFTVILALSTIFLWFATRDLVKEAKRTSERQIRAYVSIKNAGFWTSQAELHQLSR